VGPIPRRVDVPGCQSVRVGSSSRCREDPNPAKDAAVASWERPNKATALVNAAFSAATSNSELLPVDFFLAVMRDPSIPPEWRFRAAQAAAPYVHPKPERAQAVDPEATSKQTQGVYKDLREDPLYEAFQAYARGSAESVAELERNSEKLKYWSKAETLMRRPGQGLPVSRNFRAKM
jgi:hypothetical protein